MLLRNLVDIASKGGNYLLNVGPTALGEIPQPSIERLREIGRWMKVNGESIYETTASPFSRLSWGRCTKKTYINGGQGDTGRSRIGLSFLLVYKYLIKSSYAGKKVEKVNRYGFQVYYHL